MDAMVTESIETIVEMGARGLYGRWMQDWDKGIAILQMGVTVVDTTNAIYR